MESISGQVLLDKLINKINKWKTPHIYEHLRSSHGIRILRLEPGHEHDPIRCSLVCVDLDTRPEFEAISYAWGDAKDRRRIICNGRKLKITRSLFDALSIFRYPDRTRNLWADAICINQTDLQERNAQVQLMAHIYNGATKVLVWLGHDRPETIQTALEYICRCVHQIDKELIPGANVREVIPVRNATFSWRGQTVDIPYSQMSFETIDNVTLSALWDLFSCAFFRRGWVIQEVSLSSIAVVHWGYAQIEFVWLGLAAYHLYEKTNLVGDTNLEASLGLYALDSIYRIYVDQTNPGRSFLDILLLTRGALFGDQRDVVYGLLGLPSTECHPLEGDTIVKADYGITELQCYQNVAEEFLVKRQDLKVFSHVQYDGVIPEEHPSWVPDWTQLNVNILYEDIWETSGDEQATISKEIRVGRECISVRGIRVDVVDQVVRDYYGSSPRSDMELQALLRQLQNRYDAVYIAWTATGGYKTTGEAMSKPSASDTAAHVSEYETFLEWDLTTNPSHPAFHLMFSSVIWRRQFFITRLGMLGIGPNILLPGDVVVVLFGGSMPFILRPMDGLWRLVGACYLHDIVDGQAIEKWKSSGEPAEDFCIY